jgi:hypothetical protein
MVAGARSSDSISRFAIEFELGANPATLKSRIAPSTCVQRAQPANRTSQLYSSREMSFSSSMDECAPVQFLPASAAAAAAPTFRSFAAQHAAESSPLHSRTPSPQDFAAAAHCNALASSSSSHRQCIYAPQPQLQFSNFSVPAPAASPPPFAIVAGWAHVAGNMFHCPQTRTSSAPQPDLPRVCLLDLLRVFISMNASFFTPSQSFLFL